MGGFATALGMLVAMGCDGGDGYTLSVEVRTDLTPHLEVAAVRVELVRDGRVRAAGERAVLGDGNWVTGERVLEASLGSGRVEVLARALDGEGATIVERRVFLDLEADRVLAVVLSRDCLDVSCAPDQTCAGGECVDPMCVDGEPECTSDRPDAGRELDAGATDAAPCLPATESCDGRDDDCDTRIDEGTACTSGGSGCRHGEYEGHAYLFCRSLFGGANFAAAEAFCAERAYHLVKIDDMAEQTYVGDTSRGIGDVRWWIGLDDRATPDDFRWHDGSAPAFTYWLLSPAQPDNYEGNESCVELLEGTGSRWNDRPCNEAHAFVCETP